MTTWFVIIGMAVMTFATRVIMIFALRGKLPPFVERWLGFVPVAVFTALIVPPLLLQSQDGTQHFTIGPTFVAGVIGTLVAWRTENVLLTIGAGLATFWLLRWIGA
jgi:branched-subunit amino acid transport protein